jgi:hypothetical protein
MKFTFGIVTSGISKRVNNVIDSIENLNIPEYEVIVIGNCDLERKNTKVIVFNENIKPKWITKKKNIITQLAKYENVVYMHDYIYFKPDWYDGWLKYGDEYKVCMNRILNLDRTRYRDWTLWVCNGNDNVIHVPGQHPIDDLVAECRGALIPYDMTHLSKYMYFSGAYWVGKKDVMLEFPLNENLIWGQGEDIQWSKEIRKKYNFSMNSYSTVQLMVQKDRAFEESKTEMNEKLKTII